MTTGLAADFAPEAIEAGRKLFAGPCDFFFAAAKSDGLPPIGAPVVVGTRPAQVVRVFNGGLAVEFNRLVPEEMFDENIRL